MGVWQIVVRWVIQPFCTLIIGRACLAVAHRSGWHPDEQLAGLLIAAPTALEHELVLWLLAAGLGGVLWALADYFLYRRRSKNAGGNAIASQPHSAKPANVRMSLIDAAREAYSESRQTLLARMAEKSGDTEMGILQFYAFWLIDQRGVPLWGKRLPSAKVEQVKWDENSLHIEVDGDRLVAIERYGSGKYVDLEVVKDRVEAEIADLNQNSSQPEDADDEITGLRRDIGRLAEDLGNPNTTRRMWTELTDRYRRIDRSDHPIWNRNPAKQLRRDYLNRCGILIDGLETRFDSYAEWQGTVIEMNDCADKLDIELSGN